MSVSGLCQVCESAQADYQCDRCGRLVCEDHFDEDAGLCVECARESGLRDRREDRDRRGGDDGWSDTGPTGPR